MNKKLPALLLGLISVLATPATQAQDEALPALVQVLAMSDEPQFQLDILKGMNEGLQGRRGVKMPTGWEDLAAKLSRSTNPQVRELTRSLSVTFGSFSALTLSQQTLMDPKAEARVRRAALDSLLAAKDPALATSLQRLLKDLVMRTDALRGLAAYDDTKSPSAILEVYPSLTAAERKDALNTLVARAAFAKALLAAVAAKTVPARDLTADIVRQLRNFKDTNINAQVTKLWGAVRESSGDKLTEITRYRQMVASRAPGDSKKGRAVFTRVCQQCHTLFEVGGKVGPDITGSNRSDIDYLLQNVLDPNAVIPNEYRTWNLETKDDRVITGIVTKQDDNAVTMVTANETIIVPRNEVVTLTQGELSMMPEGLLQALTDEEVCDLVAYLRSPAQVPTGGVTVP